MLYESSHVRAWSDDGIATLDFRFPGPLVNALSLARLRDITRGLDAVRTVPGIELVVLRSGTPAGFCGGFDPAAVRTLRTDADAAVFAAEGQRLLNEWADSPVVSLAFIEGPCVGPGWDLALACDYRLAVAGPDSRFAFGDTPTCWGSRTRLAARIGRRAVKRFDEQKHTARELAKLGVLDAAFCDRRAKIELRTWLDRQQRRPRKRPALTEAVGFADERRAFRAAVRAGLDVPTGPTDYEITNPVQPLRSVGLVGDDPGLRRLAAEFACRGVRVVWVGPTNAKTLFDDAVRRGRTTPLEAEQATGRITVHPDAEATTSADLVVLDDTACGAANRIERDLPPRAGLAVPPSALSRTLRLATRPGRVVGLAFTGESVELTRTEDTTPDALAAITTWLGTIGCATFVTTGRLTPAFVGIG
jgi:enoyl-CoA hydratase/carnithine racemase